MSTLSERTRFRSGKREVNGEREWSKRRGKRPREPERE